MKFRATICKWHAMMCHLQADCQVYLTLSHFLQRQGHFPISRIFAPVFSPLFCVWSAVIFLVSLLTCLLCEYLFRYLYRWSVLYIEQSNKCDRGKGNMTRSVITILEVFALMFSICFHSRQMSKREPSGQNFNWGGDIEAFRLYLHVQ